MLPSASSVGAEEGEDAGGGSDDCCLLDPRFGRKETWSMAGEILQHIAIVKPLTNIQYIEKINCI